MQLYKRPRSAVDDLLLDRNRVSALRQKAERLQDELNQEKQRTQMQEQKISEMIIQVTLLEQRRDAYLQREKQSLQKQQQRISEVAEQLSEQFQINARLQAQVKTLQENPPTPAPTPTRFPPEALITAQATIDMQQNTISQQQQQIQELTEQVSTLTRTLHTKEVEQSSKSAVNEQDARLEGGESVHTKTIQKLIDALESGDVQGDLIDSNAVIKKQRSDLVVAKINALRCEQSSKQLTQELASLKQSYKACQQQVQQLKEQCDGLKSASTMSKKEQQVYNSKYQELRKWWEQIQVHLKTTSAAAIVKRVLDSELMAQKCQTQLRALQQQQEQVSQVAQHTQREQPASQQAVRDDVGEAMAMDDQSGQLGSQGRSQGERVGAGVVQSSSGGVNMSARGDRFDGNQQKQGSQGQSSQSLTQAQSQAQSLALTPSHKNKKSQGSLGRQGYRVKEVVSVQGGVLTHAGPGSVWGGGGLHAGLGQYSAVAQGGPWGLGQQQWGTGVGKGQSVGVKVGGLFGGLVQQQWRVRESDGAKQVVVGQQAVGGQDRVGGGGEEQDKAEDGGRGGGEGVVEQGAKQGDDDGEGGDDDDIVVLD